MIKLTTTPATLIAATALGLLLAGCASGAEQTADSAVTSQEATSSPAGEAQSSAPAGTPASAATTPAPDAADSAAQSAAQGAWVDQATYEANAQQYHDAGDVVLFFNASWCPTCQAAVANLDADGVPAGLTVVSVDYDDTTELKQEYGVTVQHTFVQIDESGAEQATFTGATSGEQIASKTV